MNANKLGEFFCYSQLNCLCRKIETQKQHHSVSHNLGRNQFPASDYPVSKKRSGRDESSTRNKRPNAAAQSFYALPDAVYRAGMNYDSQLRCVNLILPNFHLADPDLAGSEPSKSNSTQPRLSEVIPHTV